VVGAVYYLKLSIDLPDMQTEGQIVGLIGRSVEAYRAAQAHETGGKAATFTVVPREVLKSPAGQALLALERCPDYLVAPPTSGTDYWRAQFQAPTGATACTVGMATDIADRMLLPSREHLIVAGDRIREVLGRDGLFAVWLSALPFEPKGPQGVEPAALALFHQEPQLLDWEEAAELAVATTRYGEFAICANPPQLTELRDRFLDAAAQAIPAAAAEIQAAKKKPLHCNAKG
ncbi:MAG TPA: hypothetical protein VMB50_02790, partial [Myxococcales bacterium]|nr:hypothetical protein [Myxococcales bacterium]